MQGDPAFPEIPSCFAVARYLLTPQWAPAALVTHRSRGWTKKPKISSFLIIQGSAHEGGILASQIRCTQPPLVKFSASRAFPCSAKGLYSAFSCMQVLLKMPFQEMLSVGSDGFDAITVGVRGLLCPARHWQVWPGLCYGALQTCTGWATPWWRQGHFQAVAQALLWVQGEGKHLPLPHLQVQGL